MTASPTPRRAPDVDVLSVSAAARHAGVTRATLYRWLDAGLLTPVGSSPPRIHRAELDRVIDGGRLDDRRRAESHKTRADLLDAAARILESDGLTACTVDAVAEHAGVSRGAVIYHFGDKDGMMTALADAFVAQFEADWRAELDRGTPIVDAYIAATTGGTDSLGGAVIVGASEHDGARGTIHAAVTRWYSEIAATAEENGDTDAVNRCLAADARWLLRALRVNPFPLGS